MAELCSLCTEKVALMAMVRKSHSFYCGTCGYKSDEDAGKLVGAAMAEAAAAKK